MSSDARSESGRERRRFPRSEVTLPVRFTTDGKIVRTGLVLSFGPGGMFIHADELLPIQTLVRVETSLGTPSGVLRCAGNVISHNRRSGTELVLGMGVQFVELPAEVQDRIDVFMTSYSGGVQVDAGGFLLWPFDRTGTSLLEEGTTESVGWSLELKPGRSRGSKKQVETPSGPAEEPTGALSPVDRLLALIAASLADKDAVSQGKARFTFAAKRLAPVDGIPVRWLCRRQLPKSEEEKPPGEGDSQPAHEPSPQPLSEDDTSPDLGDSSSAGETGAERPAAPDAEVAPEASTRTERGSLLLRGLAAQMWIIETLDDLDWRLERGTPEHLASLEEALVLVKGTRTTIEGLGEPAPTQAGGAGLEDSSPVLEEARSGLGVLERFLTKLAANLRLALCTEAAPFARESPTSPRSEKPGIAEGEVADWLAQGPEPAEAKKPKILKSRPALVAVRSPSAIRTWVLGFVVFAAAVGLSSVELIHYLRSRPPPSYGTYVSVARAGLAALKTGDRSTLEALIGEAQRSLEGDGSGFASFVALRTGRDALKYLSLASEAQEHPTSWQGRLWGPGKRLPDLESYLRVQERNASRAKSWMVASQELIETILGNRRAFQLESDPANLETITNGAEWLKERTKELEAE